jgi:hypothetical protein
MRKSYCGLCDDCQLGRQDFMEAVEKVQGYVDQLRVHWWTHCFPADEGFSFTEFKKGLKWFLTHTDCPGCQEGRGSSTCPIRICAIQRKYEHCDECPDLETCKHFNFILKEYPDQKILLRRRQLKRKAREFHAKKTKV